MSIVLSLFLIGISLSMDTFSISLSIGSFNISKRKILLFSLLVGVLHFFMPLFGFVLGEKIVNFLNVNVNFLLGVILILIGIEMLISLFNKEEKHFDLSIINMFLIAISVSLDSFSTGLGLSAISSNIVMSGVIFSVCAFSFTFMGLLIGKYSSGILGIYGNILGIILLFVLGIFHLFA